MKAKASTSVYLKSIKYRHRQHHRHLCVHHFLWIGKFSASFATVNGAFCLSFFDIFGFHVASYSTYHKGLSIKHWRISPNACWRFPVSNVNVASTGWRFSIVDIARDALDTYIERYSTSTVRHSSITCCIINLINLYRVSFQPYRKPPKASFYIAKTLWTFSWKNFIYEAESK